MFSVGLVRHLVDIGDHRRSVQVRDKHLPSNREALYFEATFDVGFHVTDPVEVVRRNVVLGERVIINAAINRVRPITRGFDIESSFEAEQKINEELTDGFTLPEGISVFHLNVRLAPDTASRSYLAAQQGVTVDPFQLILEHVTQQQPNDEGTFGLLMQVWQAHLQREETQDARANELLRYLIERGVVQPADVERFRDDLTERVRRSASPRPTQAGWKEPPVMPKVKLQRANDRPPE
jgi:hypothetical protein